MVAESIAASCGTTIDGKPFDFASLKGRPTAVYLWCPCAQGPQVRLFAEAARSRSTVNFALVSSAPVATTEGLVKLHGLTFPVISDPQSAVMAHWKLRQFPMLMLLDADGNVAGSASNLFFDEAGLGAILDAFEAGRPIPAQKGKTPAPTDAMSATLTVGQAAPDWSRPARAGGDLSPSQFRGKPTAYVFWRTTDPQQTANVEAIVAAWSKRADAVSLVLVVGEEADVHAGTILDEHHWQVPVAYDWDGEASDRWGLIYYGNLVALDASGRVQTVLAGCCPDPDAVFDALATGAPMPLPTDYTKPQ